MREKSKKIINFTVLIMCIFIVIITFSTKVKAKSYNIDNMDIQGTIQEDGSLDIVQKIKYNFNGEFNGIFIDIPCNYEDLDNKKVIKNNIINDKLYNASDVILENVGYLDESSKEIIPIEKYEINNLGNNIKQFKVYSHTVNSKKTFVLKYKIKNLCVFHNDIGELYYNFIGGRLGNKYKKIKYRYICTK